MEEIIQFLVIIGVLFIGFVSQNKKKNRQSTEEAFPPIFDYENEEPEKKEPQQPVTSYTPSIFPSAEISQGTSIEQAIRRSQASSPKSSRQATGKYPVPKKSEAPRINLRSSQKAREAFIYSEIFTRKYE